MDDKNRVKYLDLMTSYDIWTDRHLGHFHHDVVTVFIGRNKPEEDDRNCPRNKPEEDDRTYPRNMVCYI
jgi:hypothetical protein